jgi:hypothetical protein
VLSGETQTPSPCPHAGESHPAFSKSSGGHAEAALEFPGKHAQAYRTIDFYSLSIRKHMKPEFLLNSLNDIPDSSPDQGRDPKYLFMIPSRSLHLSFIFSSFLSGESMILFRQQERGAGVTSSMFISPFI